MALPITNHLTTFSYLNIHTAFGLIMLNTVINLLARVLREVCSVFRPSNTTTQTNYTFTLLDFRQKNVETCQSLLPVNSSSYFRVSMWIHMKQTVTAVFSVALADEYGVYIELVGGLNPTPLKKIRVRQLGWLASQLIIPNISGKIKSMATKPPTSKPLGRNHRFAGSGDGSLKQFRNLIAEQIARKNHMCYPMALWTSPWWSTNND